MSFRAATLLVLGSMLTQSLGELVERTVNYEIDGEPYEGFIAYDNTWSDANPRPGVLVVHQWQGLGDTEEQHARDLAAHGMVGFAVDMYGTGCRGQPCGPETSTFLRENPAILRLRASRGLEVLAAEAFVDRHALGANGYCFGGTVVLEMARVAAPVQGIASFHGGLVPLTGDTAIPSTIGVQVHTGDTDPITANDLDAMNEEMRLAQLDNWQSFIYGNCAHGWTDPNSGAYRQREGVQAHEAMFQFYSRLFVTPPPGAASMANRTAVPAGEHVAALRSAAPSSPLVAEQQRRVAAEAELAELRRNLTRRTDRK